MSNKVAEGRFELPSEAVRAGFRLLEAEETRFEMLRAATQEGIDSGIGERTPEDVHFDVKQRMANIGRLAAK